MENNKLLKEITYWSQLISDGGQHLPHKTMSSSSPTGLKFSNRYSKINSNYKKVNAVTIKHHQNNADITTKTSLPDQKYSYVRNNSRFRTEYKSQHNFHDHVPFKPSTGASGPSQKVYINRNMLSVTNKGVGTVGNKPSGIHYNPKFIKSSVCGHLDQFSPPKPKQVAINPAFFKPRLSPTTISGIDGGKHCSTSQLSPVAERVYVNPKFLKPQPAPTSAVMDSRSIHPAGIGLDLPDCPAENNKEKKFIIGKHKLIRRRSVSSSNGVKQVPQKFVSRNLKKVINNKALSTPKKLQIIVEKKLKLRDERLKLVQKTIRPNKEFKGSKYSIIRCKSEVGSCRNNVSNGEVLSPYSPLKAKIKNNLLKIIGPSQRLSEVPKSTPPSSRLDSFRLIGKTKLLRKSVLLSHIIARRCLTNSRYKYVKQVMNSDKKVSFQANSVLKLNKHKFGEVSGVKKNLKLKIANNQLSKNHKKSFVNIGGILYRATHNKLTRKDILKGSKTDESIIRVRGIKFSLNNNGRTLRRLRKDNLGYDLNKIDINRLTSVNLNRSISGTQATSKTLISNSRMRLKAARQKSMAVLTAKLRKSNQPCLFYNRFGYCKRKENSTCVKVHDPKLVAVCNKFLKGECAKDNCLLSHSLLPEKMPICYHFLRGGCVRDSCPFLHVKHNSKTPICLAFLEGYCSKALTCGRRHEYICPKYSELGVCPKGENCSYPHPPSKCVPKAQKKTMKLLQEKRKTYEGTSKEVPVNYTGEVSNVRYFLGTQHIDQSDDGKNNECVNENVILIEDSDDEFSEIEKLPQYIPLDQTDNLGTVQ